MSRAEYRDDPGAPAPNSLVPACGVLAIDAQSPRQAWPRYWDVRRAAMTAGHLHGGRRQPGRVLRRRRAGHQRRAQYPAAVAVTAAGSLMIADAGSHRIRAVSG